MAEEPQPEFRLDPASAAFEIRNYNWARPFSNFLPGIAGKWGSPAWAFWVNRSQLMMGVGAEDRDGQILELYSFNKAATRVATEGFRTFIRLDEGPVYEPFRRSRDREAMQVLRILPHEVAIEEIHEPLGIRVEVVYHTLPGLRAAGLVRSATITNLTDRGRRLEWLDGVPRILPYGIDQHGIKVIPRHIEAMIGVDDRAGTPLFRLKQTADDSAAVGEIEGAHFYWSTGDGPKVVDPVAVFGDPFAFDDPLVFEAGGSQEVAAAFQMREGRTPCAFTVGETALDAGESASLFSVLGRVSTEADIDPLTSLGQHDWAALRDENRAIVDEIADNCFTASSSPIFDAYCRQNFLDNVIRGGMPVTLAGSVEPAIYAFSHQNADLERDYHQFTLDAGYLSQGLGHYRSILQNRRNDSWFFPGIGDVNLKIFFGLIQLDGYNPLEVRPQRFLVVNHDLARKWASRSIEEKVERSLLLERLTGEFTLGALARWLEDATGVPAAENEGTLVEALAFLEPGEVGDIHAGYWIDHWHYALDMLEALLAIYPDRIAETLLNDEYTWFDDPDCVIPRDRRIEERGKRIGQFDAVRRDPEKEAAIALRADRRNRVRRADGSVLRSTLLEKLLLIVATRVATLDPSGLGIEMEAGKPGWNDSLNGLPAMFGSGLSETLETRRLVRLLQGWIGGLEPPFVVYEELANLLAELGPLLDERASSDIDAFAFWDRANAIKEAYRERTRLGAKGTLVELSRGEIEAVLSSALTVLDTALDEEPVRTAEGLPQTYFVNRPARFTRVDDAIRPRDFEPEPVGPFLEGPMHWMREFPEDAPEVYRAVRESALFDPALAMYKSSGPMGDADPHLGRAIGAYPPGWLENESIYTHMEFKYLVEVLRSGLSAEFWENAQRTLTPFMDPAVYGRSPLEGCSFIVSSAYPDPSEHGRGYQPRLSGMTTEFISVWLLATVGPRPFRAGSNGLEFAPEPRLPGWLFTDEPTQRRYTSLAGERRIEVPEASFAFRLMGSGIAIYTNPARADTFGPQAARPQRFEVLLRDGSRFESLGPSLDGGRAEAVRRGLVEEMTIELG